MQYLEGAIEKLQAQNAELLQKLDSLKDQSHELIPMSKLAI